MKHLVVVLLLVSCGGEDIEENNIVFDDVNQYELQCRGMKNLWQVECFCYPNEGLCEGRRYVCWWDLSRRFGLRDYPEMEDLYEIFYAERIACRENSVKLDDINPCDDLALERAIKRCEERLSGGSK